jgi:hypothetical protein
VPAVLDDSTPGDSSTWIGVQSAVPGGPFIQLGTYSVKDPSSPSDPGQSRFYGIFWSDTVRRYLPVSPVRLSRPGDLIAFDMVQSTRGWHLVVHDVTVGWSRSIEVAYGGSATFSESEFIQEDPAAAEVTTIDAPYPLTSTVTFEQLKVNHRAPRLNFSDALVLSTTSHVFQVPSHPRHDGFTLRQPTGSAAQLLTDLETFESGVAGVNLAYAEHVEDPAQGRLPPVREMTHPMLGMAHLLATQEWPHADQADVRAYAAALRQSAGAVDRWGLDADRSWATLAGILRNMRYVSYENRLRASLGLPPAPH